MVGCVDRRRRHYCLQPLTPTTQTLKNVPCHEVNFTYKTFCQFKKHTLKVNKCSGSRDDNTVWKM